MPQELYATKPNIIICIFFVCVRTFHHYMYYLSLDFYLTQVRIFFTIDTDENKTWKGVLIF